MKTAHKALLAVLLSASVLASGMSVYSDEAPVAAVDQSPGIEAGGASNADNSVAQAAPKSTRVALFVKNQTRKAELNDEVDGLRDMIAAELMGAGMIVLDKSETVDAFQKYKITTDEERTGLVDGLFAGGSAVRTAQILGADYVALVTVVYADKRSRAVSGENVTVYDASLVTKVLDGSSGDSVFGKTVRKTYPSTGGGATDDAVYYHDLFADASTEIGAEMADSVHRLSPAGEASKELVSFTVHTSIDSLINGLESGVRGPNDVLDELRHSVAGVTVELDGLALGSAPGTFKTAPGLHQLRVTRQWMQPWQETVNIQDGADYMIALELSTDGLAKYESQEGFKSVVARNYAEAAYRKGIKIDFDTKGWRDVGIGDGGADVNVQQQDLK